MTDTFGDVTRNVPMVRYTEREVRIWRHFWRTTALTGVLVPLLFLGAIGLGLGGLVEQNSGTVGGFEYLVFVAPGILAATALQAAAGDSLWPVMAGTKWTRSYHAAAATPLAPRQVYGGYLTWIGARMMLNSSLFMLVAALLGAVPSWWGVLDVPAAALGGLAFAAPLCAYSAAQDSDLSFPVIMRVAVMPMFLFSGTFFPVDQLPTALEVVARVTPLWHAVELCRGLTTGTLSLASGAVHVAYLCTCVAVGAWFGVRTFTARLAP
jgi:lipooligosaccharide transport system permease protein